MDRFPLRASQAAKLHGVSRVTVRNWIKRGWLDGGKVGGWWHTSEEALAEFFRRRNAGELAAHDGGDRTPAEARREHERAVRELIEAGW